MPKTSEHKTIKSYTEIEREFAVFFQEFVKTNPLKKVYNTKEFSDIVFQFMETAPSLQQAKRFFEERYITPTVMKTVINKMSQEIKTEFMSGNICFISGLGFYGLSVKKNTKQIGVRNFRVAHYKIRYNPFTAKPRYHKITICPNYETFCQTCFNIMNNPAIMP